MDWEMGIDIYTLLLLLLCCVQLLGTPWTVAHQPPLSMGFSRKEYWSGLPFPPPGNLLNPGTKPRSPTLLVDYLPLNHQESSGKSCTYK